MMQIFIKQINERNRERMRRKQFTIWSMELVYFHGQNFSMISSYGKGSSESSVAEFALGKGEALPWWPGLSQ